jgi:hypothetical protein
MVIGIIPWQNFGINIFNNTTFLTGASLGNWSFSDLSSWFLLVSIIIGLVYLIIGLTLFFTGVNIGFISTGAYIGQVLAVANKWLMIPIGMLVGLFIVFAEPAVHVLSKQVENVTDGVISTKTMLFTLAISMAIAVGLAMLRVVTKINILWIIVPGYAIALLLMFFAPSIFTGIAFDSGGVASGPMTATFLLPFAAGASMAISGGVGGNETFGVVAIVAMTPLLAIQIIGLIFKFKQSQTRRLASDYFADMLAEEGEIIDIDVLSGKNSPQHIMKKNVDERIAELKTEIEDLRKQLSDRRAELSRYVKRRNNFKKEDN